MRNAIPWLFLLGVIVTAFVIAAVGYRRRKAPSDVFTFPFQPRRPLTEREQVFYWKLRRAMPDLVVMPQVALSRFLEVKAGHNQRAWLNRINRMTIDFLVCLPDSTVVAAIELDDATHLRPESLDRDRKKSKAIESAGLPLLRYSEVPSEDELRREILGDQTI